MEDWFNQSQNNQQQQNPVGRPRKDAEPQLIENDDEFLYALNEKKQKVQILTNDAYSTIVPLAEELMGEPDNPQRLGQIGDVRRKLNNSPLIRTDIGRTTWAMTKNVETLNAWQSRYSGQLEEYIDAFTFLCESAKLIIMKKNEAIAALNLKIKMLQEQYAGTYIQKSYPPHLPPPQTIKPQTFSPVQEPQRVQPKIEDTEQPEDKTEIPEEEVLAQIPMERRKELEDKLEACNSPIEYMYYLNQKKWGKEYHPLELQYFKIYARKTNLYKRLAEKKISNVKSNINQPKMPNFSEKSRENSDKDRQIDSERIRYDQGSIPQQRRENQDEN
jgi:hypothetical protein